METKPRLSIKAWAEEDRPREKMMAKGPAALSDAELLAILIGSGNPEETAVELTRRILASCGNNLSLLGKMSIRDLCAFNGIGPAKAVSIAAALELGKRRTLSGSQERPTIHSSRDAYAILHPILADIPHEEFWAIYLNQAHKVIGKSRISTGGLTATLADTRTILREALLQRATSLIVAHNHPSGSITPSREDNQLTARLQQAAHTMDITLCDHLVVSDGAYYSYADEGKL